MRATENPVPARMSTSDTEPDIASGPTKYPKMGWSRCPSRPAASYTAALAASWYSTASGVYPRRTCTKRS
jgi:hypothetical protein